MAPEAVSDLVSRLAFAVDARRADEGRSAFSAEGGGTKLGEKIVDERVRLWSDPQGLGSAPYTGDLWSDPQDLRGDGLPVEPMTWVEDGVLKNLSYSRFWAEEQGKQPTGRAVSLRMAGTDKSMEDLISETQRGVFVTRLWYIRSTDPRTISYTGLTRDGTFWIEDGEIQYPVNNFRWNDSPLSVLSSLEDMSRAFRVRSSREVPAIRVGEFNFTSVSEAV
jgi:predicted Zn-dependent protease